MDFRTQGGIYMSVFLKIEAKCEEDGFGSSTLIQTFITITTPKMLGHFVKCK